MKWKLTLFASAMSIALAGTAAASEQPQSLLEAMAEMGVQRSIAPLALGEPGGNLVVNPVTPCRLLDTREASPRGGPMLAQQTRAFFAFGEDFSATQGGAEGDCGLGDDLEVEAIVINLTVVEPRNGGGYATAWPMGEPLPLAATLTYAQNQTVTNEVIVPINADPANEDFQIYTYRQAHVVADVVGFLSRPEAAELDCVLGEVGEAPVAAGTNYQINAAPECPVGYSMVAPSCDAAGSAAEVVGFATFPGIWTACAYRNTSASSATVNTAATCCRVPGR